MLGELHVIKHKDYDFGCWYWETTYAWGHEVRLCKCGIEVGRARIRYYNRTWERYTYQSAMRSAVEDYKRRELDRFIERYKCERGLAGYDMDKHEWFSKPFKRGQKAQALAEFEKTEYAKDIEELNKFIEER